MKKLLVFTLLVGIIFTSCTKEDDLSKWKTFAGKYISTGDNPRVQVDNGLPDIYITFNRAEVLEGSSVVYFTSDSGGEMYAKFMVKENKGNKKYSCSIVSTSPEFPDAVPLRIMEFDFKASRITGKNSYGSAIVFECDVKKQ